MHLILFNRNIEQAAWESQIMPYLLLLLCDMLFPEPFSVNSQTNFRLLDFHYWLFFIYIFMYMTLIWQLNLTFLGISDLKCPGLIRFSIQDAAWALARMGNDAHSDFNSLSTTLRTLSPFPVIGSSVLLRFWRTGVARSPRTSLKRIVRGWPIIEARSRDKTLIS